VHSPYQTVREGAEGKNLITVNEDIMGPMAIAGWLDERTIDVTVINGREGRAIERRRNRAMGATQKELSTMKGGWSGPSDPAPLALSLNHNAGSQPTPRHAGRARPGGLPPATTCPRPRDAHGHFVKCQLSG
jgi:hypothetical protein